MRRRISRRNRGGQLVLVFASPFPYSALADRRLKRAARTRTDVDDKMNGWFWGLGILYLVLIATLAVMTFRKGHWVLGLIGFIFPVLWLIGAVLPSRYRHARH